MSEATQTTTTPMHRARRRLPTMAALDCQITPMDGAIQVTFFQPLPPDLIRAVKGALVAQVHARGKLHHYRIKGADGAMYFVPRRWLDGLSRVLIAQDDRDAGRPLGDVCEQLDDLIDMMRETERTVVRPVIEHDARGRPSLYLGHGA